MIGDSRVDPGSLAENLAEGVGRGLVDRRFRVVTGGLGGVMEAACRGARSSSEWRDGDIVGVVPGPDPAAANRYVDIAIATDAGHGRNRVVAQSDAVVTIGGGAGTLSEVAFAWMYGRLIVALRCPGWSDRLADTRIDERVRHPDIPDDRVFGASTAAEAVDLVVRYLPAYAGRSGRGSEPARPVRWGTRRSS